MRKNLTAAAALAPFMLIVGVGHAWATTTISTGRSTPIATATANNGAADDVDIATGGSVALSSPAPGAVAVTLNSNNKVTNEGAITFQDVNNVTGVLINGGVTGSFTNTGQITISESRTLSDSNGDGVTEAPFATGTGRTGVLVQGGAPFVGDITNGAGGLITVTGNNSFGISVEAPLTGNLINAGAITISGDNSIGLRETAGVSGNVSITGSVSATGQNSNAVVLSGDVGGRFNINSAVSSTGYTSTVRSPFNNIQTLIQQTATETEQGGSAVVVQGNIAGGILIGATPVNTVTGSTADVDGDGVADGSEGTGSITEFGKAPALLIGAAGKNLTIGPVQLVGITSNFGLIVGGSISASGVLDGVDGNAIQIGADGGTVNLSGGISVAGSVTATSFGGNATAIHLLSGTSAPTINVGGAIAAAISSPVPNPTTGAPTPYNGTAIALQIDAGATVNTLNVTGAITATAVGDTNNVTAVIDNGGGINRVTVSGDILASVTGTSTTAVPIGTTTALDLHNNTTGVTLTMNQAPTTTSTAVTNTDGTVTTTLTTGAVIQNTTGAPIVTTTTSTDGKTVTTVTTPEAPKIQGDILLGNGPNVVNVNAGVIDGALGLGSNTASISIDNGGTIAGRLSYTGTALALDVKNGVLVDNNPTTLTSTGLHVGANGEINFAIDPVNNRATNFIVNGSAILDSGAKIGVNLLSTLTTPTTFTLIHATNLSVAGADATLAADVPFLFFATVHTDAAAGNLNLTIREKTAQEMGLNQGQAALLPAITTAVAKDAEVQDLLFSQNDRAGFLNVYNQFLPDYAGGIFRAASAASRTISRLTSEPNQIENPTGSRGTWAHGQTSAFRAGGFGYVGGIETGGMGFGAVGATAAFVAVNISDPHSPGDNRTGMSELEGGLYWQGETGGLTLDARVGAGFNWFSAKRQLLQTDATLGTVTLSRQTKASWTGYSLSGRFGAAYQIDLNKTWFVRPTVHLDYFRLDEGSYAERFGGDAFNLAYGDRVGDEASGTASMIFGAKLGQGLVWRPELELGVRDVFTGNAGDTTARFVSGGPSFTLNAADITGPAGIARIKLKASSEYYEVGLEAGTELHSRYGEGDAKLTVRVLF